MTKPNPYIRLTTAADHERLIRGLWPLGVRVWKGPNLDQTVAKWIDGDDFSQWCWVGMYHHRIGLTLGLWQDEAYVAANEGLKARMNSIPHFVAYVRSLQAPVNEEAPW